MSTKHTAEIKPIPLSQVDAQMEFYKQAVAERDRLREALDKVTVRAGRQLKACLPLLEHSYGRMAIIVNETKEEIEFIEEARAALKEGK